MADLYLKKKDLEQDVLFDIVVQNNDLQKDDSYLTASLISIFTDASIPQIGEQIDGKILGNKKYNIDKLSADNIKAYESGLLEALQWLLDDKIVKSITTSTEKIGNALAVTISFVNNKDSEDNLIYSLDQNMELLD